MKKCLKLTITGVVQGVGLKSYIQKQAEKIGTIEGTAQNMPDGSVLVFVCGEESLVDNLIDQIYKGTPKSKVDFIFQEALVGGKDFRGVFRVIG